MTMPEGWSIRPVTPDDADAFARCHAEAVALTYAHIMPPEFGDSRLAEIGEAAGLVDERRGRKQRSCLARTVRQGLQGGIVVIHQSGGLRANPFEPCRLERVEIVLQSHHVLHRNFASYPDAAAVRRPDRAEQCRKLRLAHGRAIAQPPPRGCGVPGKGHHCA